MDHQYGYTFIPKDITRISTRIPTQRQKKIIDNQKRIIKNCGSYRYFMNYNYPIGNFYQSSVTYKTQNSHCKTDEKNRKKTSTQRQRY